MLYYGIALIVFISNIIYTDLKEEFLNGDCFDPDCTSDIIILTLASILLGIFWFIILSTISLFLFVKVLLYFINKSKSFLKEYNA